MQILKLVQGSDEWLEARLKYLCASEAPAIMGESKFMSRNQLLALKKGWLSNPVGDFKQRLFDKGHESEEEARELLEIEMCGDMPPVVGLEVIDGLELLSSFDGYGDAEPALIWEHKEWNVILAENVRNAVLEALYYWQLEHQMLTAGVDEVLFMVSNGTMEKRLSMVYKSVPERRAELIAGWKQFLIDLDQYELEAKKETVVARKQDIFPSVDCRVEGSTVVSNLGDFIPLIQAMAEEQMSVILETDQDFADKRAFNKNVKDGRDSLKLKASEIETAFESLAEFNADVKQADSILQKLFAHGEKQVKDSDAAKKLAITSGAENVINQHLAELSATINNVQIHGVSADWNALIKGKRSFGKMEEAVDAEIAKLKIQANEIAATIRKNLDSLTELAGEHKFLFADHAELILKNNDDLVNLIKMRISEHEKAEEERLEQERKDMQAKADAKAQRDAEAKAEQERDRIRKEEREKAQAEKAAELEEANNVARQAREVESSRKKDQEPVVEPEVIGADMASEPDQSVVSEVEARGTITIEVPESKRSAVISILMDQMDVVVKSDRYVVVK